jgi:hypothetical protein
MSTYPLDYLEPSDRPLLDLVFGQIDDAMLLEIARCDYGDDVEIHLAALHQIRAKNIPVPLKWHPGEVLSLTSWTEWDSLSSHSTRNHWMRLFACTVLIWASLEPENYVYQVGDGNHSEGEDSTIIQLIDSALYLGDDVATAALKFLGWRMQSQLDRALIDEDFGECSCYSVAMLLLCVSLDRCNLEIISFLISIAYCNHEYIPISKEINDCQRSQKWRDTIDRILLDPTAQNDTRSSKYPAWRSSSAIQSLGLELMGDATDRQNSSSR